MNICKEKEKLEILKIEADVKYRQAIPSVIIPLGQSTTKGQTHDGATKQKKLEQEYIETKEKYEFHKTSCLVCAL